MQSGKPLYAPSRDASRSHRLWYDLAMEVRAVRRMLGGLVLAALLTLVGVQAAAARTVWLCRPGVRPDPCTPGLSTTVYSPTLRELSVQSPKPVARPLVDCFYVYPTVSDQTTEHANLAIDPEERSVALYQVARYSQYCRMFAPMYRQVTVPFLERTGAETPADLALPLSDVRSAFQDFLRHYAKGRGFILIGQSQGSFLLRELIAKDVDPKPALRRQLVTAILMGGNVLVKRGSDVGGDFKHIAGCRRPAQLSCVVAFSTFDAPPPANTLFGRSGNPNQSVLCTDPAALAGGGLLDPIYPSQPFAPGSLIAAGISMLGITQPRPSTVWSSEPESYSAHCSSAGGTDVLEIAPRNGAQTPHPSPTPNWGLHLVDSNVALGNLLTIVRQDANAFARRY